MSLGRVGHGERDVWRDPIGSARPGTQPPTRDTDGYRDAHGSGVAVPALRQGTRAAPLGDNQQAWRRRAELTQLCLCVVLSEQRGRPQRSLFAGVAALSVLVAVGIVALAAQVHWQYSGVRGALCSCGTHHRSVLFLVH